MSKNNTNEKFPILIFIALEGLFVVNSHQTLFQGPFCSETNKEDISIFFNQNHGLTPLK